VEGTDPGQRRVDIDEALAAAAGPVLGAAGGGVGDHRGRHRNAVEPGACGARRKLDLLPFEFAQPPAALPAARRLAGLQQAIEPVEVDDRNAATEQRDMAESAEVVPHLQLV